MLIDLKSLNKAEQNTKEPENQQLISEYCDFLQEYLSQGLLEGQMELVQRNQYIKLLKKKLKFKEDLHTYVCLIEKQMQMKEYEQVLKSLERMDKKWHRNEEYAKRLVWLFCRMTACCTRCIWTQA